MEMTYHDKLVKLGLNIVYYRKLKGYSQMQLAEIIDCSRNQIGRIERGKTAPSFKLLHKICTELDTTEKQLFDFKDE